MAFGQKGDSDSLFTKKEAGSCLFFIFIYLKRQAPAFGMIKGVATQG